MSVRYIKKEYLSVDILLNGKEFPELQTVNVKDTYDKIIVSGWDTLQPAPIHTYIYNSNSFPRYLQSLDKETVHTVEIRSVRDTPIIFKINKINWKGTWSLSENDKKEIEKRRNLGVSYRQIYKYLSNDTKTTDQVVFTKVL